MTGTRSPSGGATSESQGAPTPVRELRSARQLYPLVHRLRAVNASSPEKVDRPTSGTRGRSTRDDIEEKKDSESACIAYWCVDPCTPGRWLSRRPAFSCPCVADRHARTANRDAARSNGNTSSDRYPNPADAGIDTDADSRTADGHPNVHASATPQRQWRGRDSLHL